MATHTQILSLCCLASVAWLLSGCDQSKPVAYQIPKEERVVNMPTTTAAQPAAAPSNMNVLPGMQQAADKAGGLSYTTPEGWKELPASGIRKATFQLEDENGKAELAVTVFPGDVGGLLANVNRWRGQVGLDPIKDADLETAIEPYTISKHNGVIVRLEGGVDSILGGLLPFHGNTWFFKLQGSSSTVLASEDSFKAFLDSVAVEDHHH
ncbi:MAG: hypothetical protein ACSHX8_03785 [Opitutaceae bacterium]